MTISGVNLKGPASPGSLGSQEESVWHAIARDWHQDVVMMVRDRLPKFVLILVVLLILWRIVRFAVGRMTRRAEGLRDHPQRAAQIKTMAAITRATAYAALAFLGFLQLLSLLNIRYGAFLASAGIIGVGIGLAAQSLFKDIINGIFILIEDQYNVGDVIRAASLTGTVEDLTLRTTWLRDGDGTLHVIPNSQIATLSNLSRDYAVATLPVSVDASANPDEVIRVLTEIATALRANPAFKDVLIADPTVLGVDKIDGRSILYPISLRVLPNQRDGVLRELRKNIVLTFEREGIPLGSDASMLIMQQAKDPPAPPSQQPLVGS